MPEFVLGFKAYADSHPEVGEPITDEYVLIYNEVTEQATSNGFLRYYTRANMIHFIPAH